MGRPKLPELLKLKNRVRKRYPGAICAQTAQSDYYINWDGENLNEIFLMNDCETEIEAWRQASITARHEQHINRTHPLKKMMANEKKLENKERITNRIRKQ
tara:strand:- start:257 stop:559 length:303 start_codon:yes stop_codon:yes gene_type:complete